MLLQRRSTESKRVKAQHKLINLSFMAFVLTSLCTPMIGAAVLIDQDDIINLYKSDLSKPKLGSKDSMRIFSIYQNTQSSE